MKHYSKRRALHLSLEESEQLLKVIRLDEKNEAAYGAYFKVVRHVYSLRKEAKGLATAIEPSTAVSVGKHGV